MCLPIEDTQDLLARSPSLPNAQSPAHSQAESTPKAATQESQPASSFHFVLDEDDTQSQMLDADGYEHTLRSAIHKSIKSN